MKKVLVREVMTESPFTLGVDADLAALYDLMDTKHVRHVPIADEEGHLVGLVSHRDLVRAALHGDYEMPVSMQRDMLKQFKVGEIMVSDPQTVDPDESLKSAGVVIFENKYGCLPVVDGDMLVGILTESDFVRYTVKNLEA